MLDCDFPAIAADASGACPHETSIDQLIEMYHAQVYRYAWRMTGSRNDAEDVVQQTFLIAHQKLDDLRDASRAGGWLNRIARNCFLKSIRRPRPLDATSMQLNVDEVPRGNLASDAIDRIALTDALAEIPEDYRIVLLMFYFEHLQYNEIAGQLGIKMGTVMSRLSRAKGILRKKLGTDSKDKEIG